MKNQEIITELKEADATLNGDKYKTWCQVRLAISSAINKLETPDIIELEDERMRWAWKTFPDATAISSLRKLESEIKEIEADINAGAKNPYEYADALMCLFDSAGRQGITPKEIFMALELKLATNKKRVWTKNPDNTYSHVKP